MIDYSLFEETFFKLEDGEAKRITITEWHSEEKYSFGEDTGHARPALVCKVLSVENVPLLKPKTWVTTSKKVVANLKPLLDNAALNHSEKLSILLMKKGGRYLVFP